MLQTLTKSIVRDSVLRVPVEMLPVEMLHHFDLPNKAAEHRKNVPTTLSFIHRVGNEYLLPRNYPIQNLLPNVKVETKTSRGRKVEFPKLDITFHSFQMSALNHIRWIAEEQLSENNFFDLTLESPCGSGKTTMGMGLTEIFSVQTLILVQTEQLADQWRRRFKTFMGIETGLIKGAKVKIKDVTIAMVQTLAGKTLEDYPELQDVGLVITDECHSVAALEWNKALWPLSAAIRIGLTATPREDGLGPLMGYATGDVGYRISHQELVEAGIVLVPDVLIIGEKFMDCLGYKPGKFVGQIENKPLDLVKTLTYMATHDGRNTLIADAIAKAISAERKVLVVIQRLRHIEELHSKVESILENDIDFGVLKGGMKPHEYETAYEKSLIYGQMQVVKQGMDLPELDTAFLAAPVSSHGLLKQLMGRISRTAPDKKQPLFVIFKDTGNILLIKMFMKCMQVFKQLGCEFR